MKLLLVDGSNMVMRCAYGGDLQPEVAVPSASGQIARAAESIGASHMVICLDTPGVPSWRKREYPEYKANRKVTSAPWLELAATEWAARGWYVYTRAGYEADDIIATLATRALVSPNFEVHVLSSDSDLLPLLATGCRVHRPGKLGELTEWTPDMVLERYGVPPRQLPELKALAGEAGDNIPGAAGIGEKGAVALLREHRDVDTVLGGSEGTGSTAPSKQTIKARLSADSVRLSLRLATLRTDVPLPPVKPSECSLNK